MSNTRLKYKYNVRWYGGTPYQQIANVDVMACNDYTAKLQIDKVEKELGITSCRRNIYQGNRCVEG